jgi:hypothetical protein
MTKKQARSQVAIGIANGTITRQPCEVCGDERGEAHHDDYDQPLAIRWLCHRHHMELHPREKRPPTEAPIMLRADITRAELADLKVLAIKAGMTTQEFLAMLIRERIAA